jgi:uncharacterized protein YjgD (DUF1641 family)
MTIATRLDLEPLAARIDELTLRVERLIECSEENRRMRSGWADFQADLSPVATRAMARTIERLDGTTIDADAVLGLLIHLAEAAPRLERTVDTLVSVGELAGEVGDVGGAVFESMIERLDTLGRRGYFTFAAGMLGVLDRIVTSFGEDDLEQLGDNVVLILQTVKEMTQPEIMQMMQRTVRIVRDGDEPEKVGLFRLLGELRDPEVKLGLHRAIALLRGLGGTAETGSEQREETTR